MSRQDSNYPLEATIRDATALITAVSDGDDQLIDQALEQALSGTDHTLLAEILARMTDMVLETMAQHTVDTKASLLQKFAVAAMQSLSGEDGAS